jgi:hypothetical protein
MSFRSSLWSPETLQRRSHNLNIEYNDGRGLLLRRGRNVAALEPFIGVGFGVPRHSGIWRSFTPNLRRLVVFKANMSFGAYLTLRSIVRTACVSSEPLANESQPLRRARPHIIATLVIGLSCITTDSFLRCTIFHCVEQVHAGFAKPCNIEQNSRGVPKASAELVAF